MTKNRLLLSLIAFLSYMIMSGLLTQIGVILNAFSADLNYPAEKAVGVFSYLTGGALIGTFMALGLYSMYSLGRVLKVCYALFLATMCTLVALVSPSLGLVQICFLVLGICCGCGLSGGAVIISKIYENAQRASAFIATDCSFSAAGYVFPTLAIWLLSQNANWTVSYGAVGVLAFVLFILLFVVRFPETEGSLPNSTSVLAQLRAILRLRVILMGVGVCAYLVAQTTFLTWAPNYLQDTFQLSAKEASAVIGNYWGLSIFGLLSSAILIHKIKPRYMLMTAVTIAIGSSLFFVSTNDVEHFLLLSFAFGFLTTCIYKIAMAVGSQQIANAPAMLVTFLLFSGGIGSASAPALSGLVVNTYGVRGAMQLSLYSFVVVAIAFCLCLLIEKRSLSHTSLALS
jgi:TsgA-like MFS transporter